MTTATIPRRSGAWEPRAGGPPGTAVVNRPATSYATLRWWPAALSVVALAVYVAAAVWMRESLHYAIGDALARSADARYVVNSRDPHLGAVGFVWLPLPVIAQLPFSLILAKWGHADLAGPLTTACCGAAAVYTLGRTAVDMGLRRLSGAVIVCLLAFNPVFVYYAGNGMSEMPSFVFYLVAARGLLRWHRDGSVASLAMIAGGLAGAMLCRYETLLLVPIFACAAAVQTAAGRWAWRWGAVALTVALPAVFMFGCWLAASQVIVRDAFFWQKALSFEGTPPPGAPWLPARTLANGTLYSAALVVKLAPGFVAIGAATLFRRRWRSAVIGAALVAAGGAFPVYVAYGISQDRSWGDPRYFAPLSVFAAVGAIVLVASHGSTANKRRVWLTACGALLTLDAVASTVALSNPRVAPIEGEPVVFGRLTGKHLADSRYNQALDGWRAVDRKLDPLLTGHKLVAVDTYVGFTAPLLTSKPTHYVIDSDRDFQAIMADPIGRVDYLVAAQGSTSNDQDLFGSVLAIRDGGRWVPVSDRYSVGNGALVTIYQWVPNAPVGGREAPGAPVPEGSLGMSS